MVYKYSGMHSGAYHSLVLKTMDGVVFSVVQNLSFTVMITLVAAFALFLVLTARFRTKSRRNLPLPPGPKPLPLIGNVLSLVRRNRPAFKWLHGLMKEMNADILCVRFGNVHVVTVSCPQIALQFLKDQDALFASRPLSFGSRLFSRGYLTTVFPPFGDQWKKMRKVLNSLMVSSSRLKWLHEKRRDEADNLLKYVYNQSVSPGYVDLRVATRNYTSCLTRKMLFGQRYFGKGTENGGPGKEEGEYVEAVFTALKHFYAFCVSDFFPFLTGLDLDGHVKILKHAHDVMNKYHDPIIDARMQMWRRCDDSNDDDCDDHVKEEQDLLDVLITMKDSDGEPLLSEDEIKAQINEIVCAAIDNSANAVEWALAEMINQPELLARAADELDRVVGKERLVQESDIGELNFIKLCARESFRLHPVAPFNLPHESLQDTNVAGYHIPKGSQVLLSRIGLGRNPKTWDEPLKFIPDRHLADENSDHVGLTEPNLRFISFSTGRRGCIAVNLGTIITTMLLARLLQGFTWSLLPGEACFDLSEGADDLFPAVPLVLQAKPRLPLKLYHLA